uniref:Serine/threonine protein phosphatase 7 long form isogeny n=1 Tax=Cajanus cajan TaxID=3821 RepID=A0A151S401_CAJCA|nr:Serine/threonine protein phosphatase 7 long form isogeny [Cajanus cajan]
MSRQIVHPKPMDKSLVKLQPFHVSEHVWNGIEDKILKVRRAIKSELCDGIIHDEIQPLLHQAEFLGVAHFIYFSIDHHLIAALVEHWRPETHTFHMTFDECIIMLEDIAIIFELKVDGKPMIVFSTRHWINLVE